MWTKFDICSRALDAVGCASIASFDDGTEEANTASLHYEKTVRAMLSKFPWRFAKHNADLDLLDEEAPSPWQAAYQLPVDVVLIREANISGRTLTSYDIRANKLLANAVNGVSIVYTRRVAESYFPEFFTDALEARLSHIFAGSLVRKDGMIGEMEKEMRIKWREAKHADSTQSPAPPLRVGRFIAARR